MEENGTSIAGIAHEGGKGEKGNECGDESR